MDHGSRCSSTEPCRFLELALVVVSMVFDSLLEGFLNLMPPTGFDPVTFRLWGDNHQSFGLSQSIWMTDDVVDALPLSYKGFYSCLGFCVRFFCFFPQPGVELGTFVFGIRLPTTEPIHANCLKQPAPNSYSNMQPALQWWVRISLVLFVHIIFIFVFTILNIVFYDILLF